MSIYQKGEEGCRFGLQNTFNKRCKTDRGWCSKTCLANKLSELLRQAFWNLAFKFVTSDFETKNEPNLLLFIWKKLQLNKNQVHFQHFTRSNEIVWAKHGFAHKIEWSCSWWRHKLPLNRFLLFFLLLIFFSSQIFLNHWMLFLALADLQLQFSAESKSFCDFFSFSWMDSREMKRKVCTSRMLFRSAGIVLVGLGSILAVFWPQIFERILAGVGQDCRVKLCQ